MSNQSNQSVIETWYRFAEPGELPPDRVVDIVGSKDSLLVQVIVRPGHATADLLKDIGEQQRSAFRTGQWTRLEPTPENLVHPRRVFDANWELTPAHKIPKGVHCVSIERIGRHSWLVREGDATPQLVAEISVLLRCMVRAEVWIQRGAGEDTDPSAN
ncbi:hypothetical protein [Streptomyces sp. V1I1]|uniref:hypothetical protein n=1 Tax=Streptomyces sp. V1I1 TaxID=3042272 RepID=UPI00277FDCD9|nr:hypothetical protein [Streptomyces sp. V1I1]MDQ0943325.1 hypothetical protein [Streptomyces sp. V1I1]